MSCDRPRELSPKWVLTWTKTVWLMLAAMTCTCWTWETSAAHLPSSTNSRLAIKSNRLRWLCSRRVPIDRSRHKASKDNSTMLLGKSDTNKDIEQITPGTLFIDDLSRCCFVQILNKPNVRETSLRQRSWIERRSRIRLTKTLITLHSLYTISRATTQLIEL